jgi:hypothetical protein
VLEFGFQLDCLACTYAIDLTCTCCRLAQNLTLRWNVTAAYTGKCLYAHAYYMYVFWICIEFVIPLHSRNSVMFFF